MKQIIYILLLFFVSFVGCSGESTDIELRINFMHEESQNYFIGQLGEEGVVFRITEDSRVAYPISESWKVSAIEHRVIKMFYPPRGIQYAKQKYNDQLKEELGMKGIEYRTYILDGKENITWEEEVDKEAKQVVKGVSNRAHTETEVL